MNNVRYVNYNDSEWVSKSKVFVVHQGLQGPLESFNRILEAVLEQSTGVHMTSSSQIDEEVLEEGDGGTTMVRRVMGC